jgi:hypothetical protein
MAESDIDLKNCGLRIRRDLSWVNPGRLVDRSGHDMKFSQASIPFRRIHRGFRSHQAKCRVMGTLCYPETMMTADLGPE